MSRPWLPPRTWTNGEIVGAVRVNPDWYTNLKYLYSQISGRLTLWHDESTVVTGNAITKTQDSAQRFMYYAYQDAAADGDQFTQSVWLNAGSYYLQMIGAQNSQVGYFYIDIDGYQVGSDLYQQYSPTLVKNVVFAPLRFNVSMSGRHVLTWTVNGKNASSVGYRIMLTCMHIYPIRGDI